MSNTNFKLCCGGLSKVEVFSCPSISRIRCSSWWANRSALDLRTNVLLTERYPLMRIPTFQLPDLSCLSVAILTPLRM